MIDYFRDKYEQLPRPDRWMPGPVAPWAIVQPNERTLNAAVLQNYIYKENDKDFALNDIARDELPEAAVEDLGDNDVATQPSAVLVPFIVGDKGNIDSVIVMTRTMTVSHHKGQVSFPGGMVEKSDSDIVETALRETHEETGIDPESFHVLGTRSPAHTRTGRGQITPVIATCPPSVLEQFSPNASEVDTLHVVSVQSLLAPDAYMSEIWDFPTMSVTIHMYFVHDENDQPVFIWGATAHMLTDILHCLKPPSLN